MSKFVLTGARLFLGGYDLTGNTNKVELSGKREAKDVTNFGSSGWSEQIGGLGSATFSGSGQWEASTAGTVDDILAADLNAVDALSVLPTTTAAVADLAYFTSALEGSYSLGGAVGDVAPWSADLTSTWPLVRGVVGHPPGTARTATGNGTGQQISAVAAGQYLYANLHVLSVSGTSTPTVTVAIKSSVDNTFASPTTQLTFTAATAVGAQSARTAGPITDTWFRVNWTISGTSPSFLFFVTLGVA